MNTEARKIAAPRSRPFDELESRAEGEKELVQALIYALLTILYGSIVLTVHDGQVVEMNKSIRIRKTRTTCV
jgi:hypothetical protein